MPDLKVYVNADPNAPQGKPKYYSAAQVENLQAELAEAKAQVEAANRRTIESIAAYQQQYPGEAAVRLRLAEVREAVPRPLDLERRPVHLHQG